MRWRLIREKYYYTILCVLLRVTDSLLENDTIIIANEGKFNAEEIIIPPLSYRDHTPKSKPFTFDQ